MTSTDKAPTTKVAVGGAAGLIAALIMWAISAWGLDIPAAQATSDPKSDAAGTL